MSSVLGGRLDEIEVRSEAIYRLIEGASADDPEVAAGLATTEPMPGVSRKISEMVASVEALDLAFRKLGTRP